MVLENLLMNYENNQLPTHGKGKETSFDLFRTFVARANVAETFLLLERYESRELVDQHVFDNNLHRVKINYDNFSP